jgi:hypothetical protein
VTFTYPVRASAGRFRLEGVTTAGFQLSLFCLFCEVLLTPVNGGVIILPAQIG